MPAPAYTHLYLQYLQLVRQGYPRAKIVALEPFCGAQADAIQQAVNEAKKAGDQRVYFVPTPGWYSGDIHPAAAATPHLAEKLVAALRPIVSLPGSSARSSVSAEPR